MAQRIAFILIAYQLILGGFSIIIFSPNIIKYSAILLLLLIFFASSINDLKLNGFRYRLDESIAHSRDHRQMFLIGLICIIFFIIKFLYFGIPILSENPNTVRIEFARSWDLVSNIFQYISYIVLVFLFLSKQTRHWVTLMLLLVAVGSLTGFRSILAIPVILVIFTSFFIYQGSILRFISQNLMTIASAISFITVGLLAITFFRFGANSEIFYSLENLFERVFLVNYFNFLIVIDFFKGAPLYLESFWWDLRGVLTNQLGFSGIVTEYSGVLHYQLKQMTPTMIGEAYANFNDFLFLFSIPIILTIRFLVLSINSTKSLYFISVIFVLIIFLPISSGQGLGSFLFGFTPKIILSSVLLILMVESLKIFTRKN